MSPNLLCLRCGSLALLVYEKEPLCGPCALQALEEHHHHLAIEVDDTVGATRDTDADSAHSA